MSEPRGRRLQSSHMSVVRKSYSWRYACFRCSSMDNKTQPRISDVGLRVSNPQTPGISWLRHNDLLQALTLAVSALLLASCSNIRIDRVESETFGSYPCSDNVMCAVDDRIRVLERDRIVTGGVARNSTGTLKPVCSSSGRLFRCVTREYVYEQPFIDLVFTAELFHEFADGYASSRVTLAPSKCEIVTTKKSMNFSYRAVDQYYNFAFADPKRAEVIDRTGSSLEDHTVALFPCNRDCAYDVKNDRWTNQIEVILSKSRTSGRLMPSAKQARMDAAERFLNHCLMEEG